MQVHRGDDYYSLLVFFLVIWTILAGVLSVFCVFSIIYTISKSLRDSKISDFSGPVPPTRLSGDGLLSVPVPPNTNPSGDVDGLLKEEHVCQFSLDEPMTWKRQNELQKVEYKVGLEEKISNDSVILGETEERVCQFSPAEPITPERKNDLQKVEYEEGLEEKIRNDPVILGKTEERVCQFSQAEPMTWRPIMWGIWNEFQEVEFEEWLEEKIRHDPEMRETNLALYRLCAKAEYDCMTYWKDKKHS